MPPDPAGPCFAQSSATLGSSVSWISSMQTCWQTLRTCWPLSHILLKRNPITGWWHLRFKKISLLASLDWDESHRPRGADWVIRVAQRHFRRPTRRALWQRIKVGDFTFTRPGPNSASASFAWELVDAEKLRFKKKRGSR